MTHHALTQNMAPTEIDLKTVMPAGLLNMFTLGTSTTLYGPSLVYIAIETGQTPASLGILFAFHWAGFFASTFTANRIARRLEMRRGAMLGVSLLVLGVLGLILLPFPMNLAAVFLGGLGNGTCEVIFNRLVEVLAGDKPAAALTRLHSTWGVGAVVIPLVVAGAVWLGWNWRVAGLFVMGAGLVNLFMVSRWHEFKMHHGDDVHWKTLPWKSILLFVALIAIYGGVETAVGAWATTFFATLGQGAFMGAIATSLFFLTFSVGRVFLASATDRLGYGRTVRIGVLAGAAALCLTFSAVWAVWGFAFAGIALSVVFTTLLAWAPRRHPEIRAQMMSISIASAGLGGIVIPLVMGIGVGALGAWALPPMLIGTLVLVALLSLRERDTA